MATDVAVQSIRRAVFVRPWSAIDSDAEVRVDREVNRKLPWRKALMRWLEEYNKY